MDISKFKIEFWLNPYDDKAKYNLGSSCCKPVTVSERHMQLCGQFSG